MVRVRVRLTVRVRLRLRVRLGKLYIPTKFSYLFTVDCVLKDHCREPLNN